MQIKLSLRQWALSTLVFAGVLIALTSVDARVRERVTDVVMGGDGLTSWGGRVSDLGSALASAARHQSIENAPLLIFAAVGAVLFVFMLKV
jgi:translation initiation factor 2B subunit (eIF-2B alpha/beta/delta family)